MPKHFIKQRASKILPVILAGGSGSRLWPASRPDQPKQFIKLEDGLSLFQQSLMRCQDEELFQAPILVVGAAHVHLAQQQMSEIGVTPAAIICEPVSRDTAAAMTLAALAGFDTKQEEQLIAFFPSDHLIEEGTQFLSSIQDAAIIARRSGLMMTFGIAPNSPETGYGYIKKGASLVDYDAHMVGEFVEKPSKSLAQTYLASGQYFWNSGMFLFPSTTFFSELKSHAPDLLHACERAMSASKSDGLIVHPLAEALSPLAKLSIDYALMEKTGLVAVLPFGAHWSDLGNWHAIWDHAGQDEQQNASYGDVQLLETSNSYAYSTGPLTTLVGMKDCVVVSTADAVMVVDRKAAHKVKDLVGQLKQQQRPEVCAHPGELRPWGRFAPLHNGDKHQVKIIEVNPGGQLSLQKHRYRAEHWIIVAGIATVSVDETVKDLYPGEHVHIPLGAVHRLENFGDEPIQMIEVQTGSYFGEDDIIRLEDVYDREAEPAKALDRV
ncbi:MAG: mannose-1-phosphate guanylyltransferase/mannose-6-phosphate isomerase [Cohaesibacter sp.]|nr:mannose-1-phosphate guanylyltransferase/mannose-6-phosphate isomerase [Cohaesibacter sp.]